MYKMTVYTTSGERWLVRHSNDIEWFDQFKHKENYRIVITKSNKIVYSEF